MTRETSAESYRWIRESGLLEPMQRAICDVLSRWNMPLTASEIASRMAGYNVRINSVTPRLAVLKRMDAIMEDGTRPCSVTKRTCLAWRLSGREPKKAPREVARPAPCPHCDGTGRMTVTTTSISGSGQ